MIVYRLSRSKYANDLSGKGAELAGGRWNSKGVSMIYTGQNISLCMAEVAVHIPFGIVPMDYELVFLEIPDSEIEELDVQSLISNWQFSENLLFTQKIGNNFIKNGTKMILKVPSAVVQNEFNYLINPLHPKINHVKVSNTEEFRFDERLFLR